MHKIEQSQARWFADWMLADRHFLPRDYPNKVALLHPGTVPVNNIELPFQGDPADPRLSNEQANALDAHLLEQFGADTDCCFAIYAGYFTSEDWGVSQGFNEPEGVWVFGRLSYILFSGQLDESTFQAVNFRWEDTSFVELSYLWPKDQSWFLASAPDVAFTLLGANNTEFSNRMFSDPLLRAHQWPDVSGY